MRSFANNMAIKFFLSRKIVQTSQIVTFENYIDLRRYPIKRNEACRTGSDFPFSEDAPQMSKCPNPLSNDESIKIISILGPVEVQRSEPIKREGSLAAPPPTFCPGGMAMLVAAPITPSTRSRSWHPR